MTVLAIVVLAVLVMVGGIALYSARKRRRMWEEYDVEIPRPPRVPTIELGAPTLSYFVKEPFTPQTTSSVITPPPLAPQRITPHVPGTDKKGKAPTSRRNDDAGSSDDSTMIVMASILSSGGGNDGGHGGGNSCASHSCSSSSCSSGGCGGGGCGGQ